MAQEITMNGIRLEAESLSMVGISMRGLITPPD
jgi:hypothetical protein